VNESTDIEATYRVTTPCFCGGADGRSAEFRLASFKGVLRYWWRALAWSALRGNLTSVKAREDVLFGSTAGGRSRVSLRLASPPAATTVTASEVLKGPGALYLGYGLKEAERRCLEPFQVTVHLRHRTPARCADDCADAERQSLIDALLVLGLVGGLGSNSRKGFGSLSLEALQVDGERRWSPPATAAELGHRLADVTRPARAMTGLPDYTALSSRSRHVVAEGRGGSLALVNTIGSALQKHRREPGGDADRLPLELVRAGFGLPRHFGNPKAKRQLKPVGHTRRASPLFIHIHECGGQSMAVLSFLPARFLPGQRPAVVRDDQSPIEVPPAQELYRPVHDFLDRLGDLAGGSLSPAEVTW
jgi:CRISPR-associated protein Cmr1